MSTDAPVTTAAPASTPSAFPINRVVAFAGPYIALLSGVIADWLVVHVHLLSSFHTTATTVGGAITQLGVFGLTSILVWAGQHKWLTGWQKYESAAVTVAGAMGVDLGGPEVAAEAHPSALGEYDPDVAGGDSAPVDPSADEEPEPPPESDDAALAP